MMKSHRCADKIFNFLTQKVRNYFRSLFEKDILEYEEDSDPNKTLTISESWERSSPMIICQTAPAIAGVRKFGPVLVVTFDRTSIEKS